MMRLTPEMYAAFARRGGLARAAKLSPARRKAIARKAGKATKRKKRPSPGTRIAENCLRDNPDGADYARIARRIDQAIRAAVKAERLLWERLLQDYARNARSAGTPLGEGISDSLLAVVRQREEHQ